MKSDIINHQIYFDANQITADHIFLASFRNIWSSEPRKNPKI